VGRYVLRRLVTAVPTLLVISFVIFAILALAPGDPLAQFAANPAVPPEVRENIRRSLGLDQPWPVRYVKWLASFAQGDWGFSFASRVPVLELIKQRLPNTLAVVGTAYLVSVLLALPIGILSAVRQYSLFDHLATTFAFVGFSVPTFFTGLLLIIVFSVRLRWLPFIYDSTLQVRDLATLVAQLKQSIMPVAVLGLFQTATLARFVRASLLENLPLDYVRTARAKGLQESRVVVKHGLRGALTPIVTIFGLDFGLLIGGAVLTERVFSLNGLGKYAIDGITNNDLPKVLGVTLLAGAFIIIANLVVDMMYAVVDPRVRTS
jgi:peptide/nickel transport system permease protein